MKFLGEPNTNKVDSEKTPGLGFTLPEDIANEIVERVNEAGREKENKAANSKKSTPQKKTTTQELVKQESQGATLLTGIMIGGGVVAAGLIVYFVQKEIK